MNVYSHNIKLSKSWLNQLSDEFQKPYMQVLREFIAQEKALGKVIFPPGKDMFNALNSTEFEQVKVVILGQDPYHGEGQAHGLCFSVKKNVPIPPSLKNIYKELKTDIGMDMPPHGHLQSWASQGVLLLNATLSVESGRAGSHQGKGWEEFTDKIIYLLNSKRESLVFILWGSYAQKKGAFIDTNKHLVLKAPHPSPLSAHRGFFGCGHFSSANSYLTAHGLQPIEWSLNE